MATAAAKLQDREESKEFAALLEQSLPSEENFQGNVVKGRVIDVGERLRSC